MAKVSVDIDNLIRQSFEFDYIRFTLCDLNGISKGKFVPSRRAAKFLKNGISFYSGTIAIGPNTEIPVGVKNQRRVQDAGNILARPVLDTIYRLPWAAQGKYSVGEVLCEPQWYDGVVQEASPRFQARKQLDLLDSMGFKLLSAFEIECYIVDKETLKPINDMDNFLNTLHFSKHDKLLFDIEHSLLSYGVDIESFHCEGGPGQFEFTFQPSHGIASADNIFKFKNAMKEMCLQKGYHATFMSKPFAQYYGNGVHFNYSLWDKTSTENIFYSSEKEDKLSPNARYFIGGILKHGKAVTALCNPTSNCYRRLHQAVTPHLINWDIDNRFTSLRVKNISKEETYMENRLPSGCSNPYIVMAATLAAGIDGIKNKIKPPPKISEPQQGDNVEVPNTFTEAMTALEKDTVIAEAMGQEFMDWFKYSRQEFDLKRFTGHSMKTNDEGELQAERDEYFEMM